jgi:hypothetical protein
LGKRWLRLAERWTARFGLKDDRSSGKFWRYYLFYFVSLSRRSLHPSHKASRDLIFAEAPRLAFLISTAVLHQFPWPRSLLRTLQFRSLTSICAVGAGRQIMPASQLPLIGPGRKLARAKIARLLYTHNPFYLISALLTLYGIYRTMPADSNVGGGWLLLGLLVGYTLMLALAGFVIIRFGQVWNDARTILLALVLLFVAMSTTFDQIVLDSPAAGARLLFLGLAFSVAVSEAMLRGLRLRLSLPYRGPYYLILAILFCYPLLLAFVSKAGDADAMPLSVLLFPVLGGLAMLTLLPAAHCGDCRELPANHPWRWPAYPWSLFVVLLVALALRSYSFSHGFESGHFGQSSFQPFFLLPLLLAASVLFFEVAISAKSQFACRIALAMPLLLLAFALPGAPPNPIADRFLTRIAHASGSPIQLTAVALATFYAVAWIRGFKLAEAGFLICATILAVVDRHTIDLSTLRAPYWIPLAATAAVESGVGVWRRTSWRQMVAAAYVLAGLSNLHWIGSASAPNLGVSASNFGIEPWALCGLCVVALGALCDDWWARQMRRVGWPLVPLLAVLAASRGAFEDANLS